MKHRKSKIQRNREILREEAIAKVYVDLINSGQEDLAYDFANSFKKEVKSTKTKKHLKHT